MASIYDKASLVLIPSGTKTSKVYSQVPVNGDGDFTFSRSTAATRVNADGNIEKETQNLLVQSNQFDTTWGTSGTISRVGGQVGYDGTNDAWLITKSSQWSNISQSISKTGVNTFSVYAKANASTWGLLVVSTTTATDPVGYFNLSNGTIGTTTNHIDAKIESIGSGGWYRISISFNQSINAVRIYPAEANTGGASSGSIYIQDAQLEQGLVARDYIETTTAAVEGGITDNVPRLDYTDSSCPALLLEPQRTNLVPQSEYLGSSEWNLLSGGTGVAPTLSYGYESPEGLNNAYEVTFNSGAGTTSSDQSVINDNIGGQAAGDYTLSFWAKVSSGTDKIIARSAGGYLYTTCNLTTEWQRFEITENLASAGSIYVEIGLRRGLANEPLNSSVTCQIYGIQLEAGSYATSYIPTYGSAVTRNQELNYITSSSSLIGQTEGVVYMDFIAQTSVGLSQSHFWLGASGNEIGLYGGTSFTFYSSGGVSINGGGFTNGQRYKVAFAYKANDYVAYVNGVQVGTDTSASVPTMSTFYINSYFNGTEVRKKNINQTLLFPTRLSNEELATLTTI